MALAPVEFLGARDGREALYYAIILWLSVMSWIIFTCDGGGTRRKGRRGSRDTKVFVGAERLCDGTRPNCSGGYGLCGSCVN
ncbi:uncharacterized protein LOC119336593 [Triticum dicoccoides]|uniref:uncharacterized protein LOC119336593 n=1 Tax=Triticum dicoccoides TaxID=85692 RepID=UPI00162EA5E5|nr:uncharacterized protein LOC119336593 [Triticum dicoccoides]XP_044431036.1 uncharacterized protein LOC123156908 [Triticum aestivum]